MGAHNGTVESKTWILGTLLIINFAFSVYLFINQKLSTQDVVYVDAIKVISNYRGIDEAKKRISSRNEIYKANLDTLQRELQKMASRYENLTHSSDNRNKEEIQNELQSKQKQVAEYEQIVREKIYKNDQELSAEILNQVNAYIKQYGERKGYTVILAATQYGNIAYGDKSVDITDEILQGLNKSYDTKRNQQ